MFTVHINPTMTKNQIRDNLLTMAQDTGQSLSKAKADKLAQALKQGRYDPNQIPILTYADPTGETATTGAWKTTNQANNQRKEHTP